MIFPRQMIKIAGETCIFCSFEREHLHHFPAKSIVAGGFLLPTCSNCNTAVNNKAPFSLKEQLQLARKNLLRMRRQFPRNSWEWKELSAEIAWEAEENFQKLELDSKAVQPPGAQAFLESAKVYEFDLSPTWFELPITKIPKEPIHLDSELYKSIVEDLLPWIEAKQKFSRRPVSEEQIKNHLRESLRLFEVRAFMEGFKKSSLIRVLFVEGETCYIPLGF